jgi:two-component system alkaline phosphatase synthesis response regulator PhoP
MNATPPNGKHVVLLVDDDADIRDALGTALEMAGYEVWLAENGADALRMLAEQPHPPAVIVLDLMMPVMDGRGFREAQLRDARLASVPLVVLSGHGEVAAHVPALRADAYCQKPIELKTLREVVARFAPAGFKGT